RMRRARRHMQMVFQDPYSSLNPRMTVFDAIAEPLRVHNQAERKAQVTTVEELMSLVELDPGMGRRYPHEFSGGQRQRIVIARAPASRPSSGGRDEAGSGPDGPIPAQVLRLLTRPRRELALTDRFVARGLAVVRSSCDRGIVMYPGRRVGPATAEELF